MVDTHEYRGLWWLSSDESEQLAGTLTITKGDAALEVLGDFGHELLSESEREKTYSLDLAKQPRIVGMSTTGKQITVEGGQAFNHAVSFPGIPTATYKGDVALVGKQFADGETIGFDEIAIRASDLNTWTDASGFTGKIGTQKHKKKGHLMFTGVDVSFKALDDIEIPLARGERALIRFKGHSEGIGFGGRTDRVTLSQDAALHVCFSKRADLDQVFDRVVQIRNFLSLAVGRPVAILGVTGYQGDYLDRGDARIPVELFWKIPNNPDPPSRRREPREMLFTLREATPDISLVMKHWFSRQARLKPVFNLFFGMRYHPSMYLDVKFLSYAQAIETYDYRRRQKPGNWSLAERMGDVLGQCRTVSKKIVGGGPGDQATFIDTFKNSRNYYTHYNPNKEKKAARGTALLVLTTQLQAIIEMSLLRQLGFGAKSIDAILERARRYEEIAHFKAILAEETSGKA